MSVFPDILSAVEDAYRMERLNGCLCMSAMRSSVAFFAAERLTQPDGLNELKHCPPWLVSEIYGWVDAYVEEGRLVVISNLGEADHSPLAKRLLELLPPKASLGRSVNLAESLIAHPSGRIHKHATYYTSVPDGAEVLHGLHREYSEAGALTETEFRHGVPLGFSRSFSAAGEEVGGSVQGDA